MGYHWVKEHLKDGNSDTTNPHCRKNPSRKDILKADEIKKNHRWIFLKIQQLKHQLMTWDSKA